MGLEENVLVGMNNPDCSFFVGHFTGSMYSLKFLFVIMFVYFLIKVLERTVFDPVMERIKEWRKKE